MTIASGERAKVKITGVECIPLHIPFAVPFKIASGSARPFVETLIVKVHTDAGVFGVGETQAWRRQGSAETLAGLVNVIKNHFEPQMVGRSPFDIAAIMHRLDSTMYHTLYAQSAVGDALYDIVGKLLDVPVHQLLGGKCREKVRVAAVLSMTAGVEPLLQSAEAFTSRGFRHLVLKIGADPAEDFRNAEALRKTYDGAIVLRVDANAELGYDAALSLLRRLESFDIECAEQPLAIWDIDGMAALARAVRMPIMADES